MGARRYATEEDRREAKRLQDREAHKRRKERGEYSFKRPHHRRMLSDTSPPDHVIDERDNAIRAKMEMDFTAIFMGDPPPGRRACDR
jgi:hypothetical protein